MSRKPGKYDAVIDQLPRLLGADPSYQDKVEAVQRAMKAEPGFRLHAVELARQYVALREEKKVVQAELSDVDLRLEAVSQMMAVQYEVEGVSTIVVDGRPVRTRLEPYPQVVDKALFNAWCRADPDLAKLMTLMPQTMAKITKDRLLAGEPEPPGVKVYAKTRFEMGSE